MFEALEFNEFGSIVKIVFGSDLTRQTLATALEFVDTWNQGKHKEAIELLAPKGK